MSEQTIHPEKVTKPIQLLAAWLVGLILVNISFLTGAQQISKPDWASALLVISAVVNVPIFIIALFVLQTKFRPQMQEDSYYAKYLQQERYQSTQASIDNVALVDREINDTAGRLVQKLGLENKGQENLIENLLRQAQKDILLHKHGPKRTISELFLAPEDWSYVVRKFEKDSSFIRDMEGLLSDGLAERSSDSYETVKLTSLGIEIAEKAKEKNMLFCQKRIGMWEAVRQHIRRSTGIEPQQ